MTMNLLSLPPDPCHEFYLKTCFVCQELAKPGQEHIRNYGGIVCFSCRQFFRRAHQKTKDPKFNCTFGGNCQITIKSRRRCQKCRYDRCRVAGMVSTAVLTDEEKTVRFRKFRQKKKQKTLELPPPTPYTQVNEKGNRKRKQEREYALEIVTDGTSNDENIEPTVSKRPKLEPSTPQAPPRPRLPEYSASRYKPSTSVRSTDMQFEPLEGARPWPALMNSKVELIVQRYQMTLSQMKTEMSEELFLKMEALLNGDATVNIGKEEVFEHLSRVAKQFHHFALLHSQFTKLRKKDQRQLLARNTPLYLQLYLSFYFSSPRGSQLLDQFQELSQRPGATMEQLHLNNPFYNAIGMLFKSGVNIHQYAQLFASLNVLRINCSKTRAVLAYIILFDYDTRMNIADAFILEDISILNEILFLSCLRRQTRPELSVENLISTLTQMAKFASSSVAWKKEGKNSFRESGIFSKSFVSLKLSSLQRRCLENQMRQMNDAFYSVTHDEQTLKEFLMFFVGVPPTVNFMVSAIRVWQERIWRILNLSPEFCCLYENRKRVIWQRSVQTGVAFMIIKKECTAKGIDQIREEYGGLTEQQFETLFRSLFERPGKIKKMWFQKSFLSHLEKGIEPLRLVHVLRDQDEHATSLLLRACNNSKEEMNSFVNDPVLEKLMFVLSITKNSKESLPLLHNTYLRLVWEHINFQGKNFDIWTSENSKSLFTKVIASLNGLNRVSKALNAIGF